MCTSGWRLFRTSRQYAAGRHKSHLFFEPFRGLPADRIALLALGPFLLPAQDHAISLLLKQGLQRVSLGLVRGRGDERTGVADRAARSGPRGGVRVLP